MRPVVPVTGYKLRPFVTSAEKSWASETVAAAKIQLGLQWIIVMATMLVVRGWSANLETHIAATLKVPVWLCVGESLHSDLTLILTLNPNPKP